MGQLDFGTFESWQLKQVLAFFNRAKEASDITQRVIDNPEAGGESQGYGIGETVAQRILDQKQSLPTRSFRQASQLNGIEGLGQDKLMDLAYSFRKPAADALLDILFDGILYDNWKVEHRSKHIADRQHFLKLERDEALLRREVGSMLEKEAHDKFDASPLARLAPNLLTETYLDSYEAEDQARFAWALWWYRIDSDNWFTHDRILGAVERYFSLYWNPDDYISFHLFKGFKGQQVWGSSTNDLPVTLNHAEQSISIWRAELFD
ncbi:MAG: hypothetical protein AAFR61_12695 [Bacteroidota bacterium]